MLEKILSKIPFKRTLATCGLLLGLGSCGETIINEYPIDTKEDIVYFEKDYSEEDLQEECKKVIVYKDNDGDWFGNKEEYISVCIGEQKEGYVAEVGDCKDNDPDVHPGKKEECDGKDNDCNKLIDDLIEACYSPCVDGKGYRECVNGEWQECSLPQPEKKETFDGKDNNCDGLIDNEVVSWQFPIEHCEINGSLSVAPNGDVLVNGSDGVLYALNPTGIDEERELWSVEVGKSAKVVLSNPVISGQGDIFISGRSVMAFNDLGELLWNPYFIPTCVGDTASGVWDDPGDPLKGLISLALSSNGLIHMGVKLYDTDFWFDDKCGYLETITSSGQVWHNKTSYSQTAPSIGEGGLVYSGNNSLLNVSNPATGSLIWSLDIGSKLTPYSPVLGMNDEVYLVAGKKLITVGLESKDILWEFVTGDIISSPVIDSNGDIYFGSEDGTFYALYPNGTDKWTNSDLGTSRTPTLTSNGFVYISRLNGLFVANTKNGNLEHKLTEDKPNEILNPSVITLGETGDIYFCNLENNRIYAVRGKYFLDTTAPWPTWQHDSQHTGNFNK